MSELAPARLVPNALRRGDSSTLRRPKDGDVWKERAMQAAELLNLRAEAMRQIVALREALKPFRGFWSDDELRGLPDSHMLEMIWANDKEDRINEETGKPYPAITVGQLRRARAAFCEEQEKNNGD